MTDETTSTTPRPGPRTASRPGPQLTRAGRVLVILNALFLAGFGVVMLIIQQNYGQGPALGWAAAALFLCAVLAPFPQTVFAGAIALTILAAGAMAAASYYAVTGAGDTLPFVLPAVVQWVAVLARKAPEQA